jgi:hypothetical protein
MTMKILREREREREREPKRPGIVSEDITIRNMITRGTRMLTFTSEPPRGYQGAKEDDGGASRAR